MADGAEDNWSFLTPKTDEQLIDFYHAAEYLAKAAEARFSNATERHEWMDDRCHRLKHEVGAAQALADEMRAWRKPTGRAHQPIDDAVRYFDNHIPMMNYARHTLRHWPIGSGVTEAACKVIIKQRLGGSGMKWKAQGARIVLALRTLVYSATRFEQFWKKVDRYGFPLTA